MRTETFGKERGKMEREIPKMAGVSNIIQMDKLRAIRSGKMASTTAKLLVTVKKETKLVRSTTMLTSEKATTRSTLLG